MKKLLRINAVLEATGLSRSSLYQLMQMGEFPKPIEIGKRAVAWVQSDVEQWIDDRIQAKKLSA